MMRFKTLALAGAVVTAIGIMAAHAAGIFPGIPGVGGTTAQSPAPGYLVPADTGLTGGSAPQTVLVPIAALGNYFGTPRNWLDNGAMNIQQRGTGTATAGTTSGCASSSYAADRWCADVNVTSGAGQLTPITASPSPPAGFTNSLKLVRNSGALTQPQCIIQEIPTVESTQLAGQTVTLSFQAAALAGLSADNGNVINGVIISGTGTDQGLGTMTASPAITPAWTGITTVINQPFTITTTFARYFVSATIPATATEVGVLLCFTPTATGAGTTDGFAVTGIQLEVSPSPSAFEFRNRVDELVRASRFFTILTEPAASVQVPVNGTAASTTVCTASYQFPVTMRSAPTFTALGTALSGTTWKVLDGATATALATTFIVTATANTVTNASLTITTSGLPATAGTACLLQGAGGGSILSWSADF